MVEELPRNDISSKQIRTTSHPFLKFLVSLVFQVSFYFIFFTPTIKHLYNTLKGASRCTKKM